MDKSVSVVELQQALRSPQPPLIIDVRRRPAFTESDIMIRGASYQDPERVADWADALPRAAHVVVYCVHGHQVSQGVAQALVERGMTARYLEGGISHWHESGGAVAAKPVGAHDKSAP